MHTVACIQRIVPGPHHATCGALFYSPRSDMHHMQIITSTSTVPHPSSTVHVPSIPRLGIVTWSLPYSRVPCGHTHTHTPHGIPHRRGSRRCNPGSSTRKWDQAYLHRDILDIPIRPHHVTEPSTTTHRYTARPHRQHTVAVMRYPSGPRAYPTSPMSQPRYGDVSNDTRARPDVSSGTVYYMSNGDVLGKHTPGTEIPMVRRSASHAGRITETFTLPETGNLRWTAARH